MDTTSVVITWGQSAASPWATSPLKSWVLQPGQPGQ